MAKQGTKKTADSVPQTPPPARSSRAKTAAKSRVFDYTKYRQAIRTAEDFQSYLRGYPDTTGLMAYLYRLVPKIDFMLIGRSENNIYETANFAEMTGEFIASKFGRGEYMLKLNDANRPNGQKEVARTWFRLTEEEKAPVYDIRTLLLGHPENVDEVNRQVAAGVLTRGPDGSPRIRVDADGQPVAAPTPVNGSADLIGRDVMGQVIMKLITQGVESPGERLKQSIEIAKLLAPPPPAAAGQPTYSTDQIADLVAAKLAANGGSNDPFRGWERIEAFLEKTGGRGGAAAAPASTNGAGGPSSLIGEIGELLKGAAAVIPLVMQGLDYMRRARGAAGGPPVVGPVAPPAANGNGDGHYAGGGGGEQTMMPLAQRIADVATLGFQKMNEGVKGWDFAAYVCIHYPGGLEVFRFLEPNGPAGVLGLAAMNPATASVVSNPDTRAQVEAFLVDFFDYDSAAAPDGAAPAASAS